MTENSRIAIVGAGPGGRMLARLLQLRGNDATVFERDAYADERPQGGSLDLHAETGQRAMRSAGLEAEFLAEARPEDQCDRLYDATGTLLFDRGGEGADRPEIDRTALRRIVLESVTPATVRWSNRVEEIRPAKEGYEISVNGIVDRLDVVVGADGGWSRVRPLLSDATPSYGGVAMVELGFDAHRHVAVDALVGSGKMFAVCDNRAIIAQRNGNGHIRGYAGWRMSEEAARNLATVPHDEARALALSAFAGWDPTLVDLVRDLALADAADLADA